MSIDVPGYSAVVKQNGTPVEFVEAQITKTADTVAIGWSIKFPYPIDISIQDEWTIERGFGGSNITLVNSVPASTISGGEKPGDYSMTITGEGDGSNTDDIGILLDYCIPKTLVFINPTWLQDVEPFAVLEDNIIKINPVTGTNPYLEKGRFYHPALPGKDVADDEFICILGPASHQAIGRYLANLIGYDFVANTPDIDLINTFTVPAGTTWFDALKANFLIWGPVVQVIDDTVYILDMMPESADISPLQTIAIDKPAILSISHNDRSKTGGGGAGGVVDHVIVLGRQTTNTDSFVVEPVDFEIIEIPEIPLSPNEEVAYQEKQTFMTEKKKLGSYTDEFGEGVDVFEVAEGYSQVIHKEYYYVYEVGLQKLKKRKMTSEVIEHYKADGTLHARTTTTFRYGPNKRPIGSSTQEEGLVRYPGEADPTWATIKWHHIFQNRFMTGVNRSLTSELIEGLVLYETNDSGDKLSPMSLADANRLDKSRTLVDKDSETNQDVLEMTIATKTTKIDRLDDDTLVQRIFNYDVLSDNLKIDRQIIENPMRDDLESNSTDEVFRCEFFSGSGVMIGTYGPCYHRPVTISHRDIDTEAIGQKLANRLFARKIEQDEDHRNTEIAIETPIPIPFTSMACTVQLPDRGYTVDGSPITIDGGDYILRSVIEKITKSGSKQTIVVRSNF